MGFDSYFFQMGWSVESTNQLPFGAEKIFGSLGFQVLKAPGARVRPSTNHWVSYQPTIGFRVLGFLRKSIFFGECKTYPPQNINMSPKKGSVFKRKFHLPTSKHWFSGDMLVFLGGVNTVEQRPSSPLVVGGGKWEKWNTTTSSIVISVMR